VMCVSSHQYLMDDASRSDGNCMLGVIENLDSCAGVPSLHLLKVSSRV
jgi:hypothetical protein